MSTPVLHLVSSVGMFGAENALLNLARELSHTSDFNPIIAVFRNSQNPHTEIADAAEKYGIEAIVIDCNGRFDSRAILGLRRLLRERNIRLLHTHGYKADFYGVLATRLTDCRLVPTCHNWTRADSMLSLYSILDRFLLRRFDGIATVSDVLREDLSGSSPTRQTIVQINNGIPLEDCLSSESRGAIRAEFGIPGNSRLVTTVGRLSREKALDIFLEASARFLPQYEDVRVVLVGDGPQRRELELLASRLGIDDRVHFTGTVQGMDRIYALVDMFVISSHTEGLPMTLLEAMAYRRPIVATRVGSIPGVLEDGARGLLVDPGDATALAGAVADLLSDTVRSRELGERAYDRVRDEYSSARMAEKYLSLYRDLMSDETIAV